MDRRERYWLQEATEHTDRDDDESAQPLPRLYERHASTSIVCATT
jgi:hypothetical protein